MENALLVQAFFEVGCDEACDWIRASKITDPNEVLDKMPNEFVYYLMDDLGLELSDLGIDCKNARAEYGKVNDFQWGVYQSKMLPIRQAHVRGCFAAREKYEANRPTMRRVFESPNEPAWKTYHSTLNSLQDEYDVAQLSAYTNFLEITEVAWKAYKEVEVNCAKMAIKNTNWWRVNFSED